MRIKDKIKLMRVASTIKDSKDRSKIYKFVHEVEPSKFLNIPEEKLKIIGIGIIALFEILRSIFKNLP